MQLFVYNFLESKISNTAFGATNLLSMKSLKNETSFNISSFQMDLTEFIFNIAGG